MKTAFKITSPTGSHIAQRRVVSLGVMHQAIVLLQWSELRYCYHKFNMGLVYLEAACSWDPDSSLIISLDATYWAWWKNHWTIREEGWLQEMKDKDERLACLRGSWNDLHDGFAMANGTDNYAGILRQSFRSLLRQMASDLNKEALKGLDKARF